MQLLALQKTVNKYHKIMKNRKLILLATTFLLSLSGFSQKQHSVARKWNDALLHAIRKDYARPTVHARNLWHTSAVMYDAWAAYTDAANPFFLGDTLGGYVCTYNGISPTGNRKDNQNEAISFAAYRLLKHRFSKSPGVSETYDYLDSLFLVLGYDTNFVSTDYSTNKPAALGNYIAEQMIAFGLQDSSNEQNQYANQYYQPVNSPLVMANPGNPDIEDPNRWQPLTLDVYIDQSGNVIPGSTVPSLSPEWGEVVPFALKESDKTVQFRDGDPYALYFNPSAPPNIDTINGGSSTDLYKWNFMLVTKWSSHLHAGGDSVMWDISPASIGNVEWYPQGFDSLSYFYDYENGGDPGKGYSINPATGQPYTPQIVPRGDYARVLAEFWADGPDSETPPGHWFTILNYVNDHPMVVKKWKGQGPILDDLEWDVKTYFTLGGTVHDAAVACWGIKGWFDYIRPVSAFRYMATQGQSSDSTLPNYSINGLPLEPGFIELVDSNDAAVGSSYQNLNKIQVRAWKGPDFIIDPATDTAGVDWILAENWWPYQRPSFVSPPFPGYMSGHSTFSRASADVMEWMTGDAYFPGGMGEFLAKKNDFLFFEEGPSMDITLQWATYRDASDQCSLSRIWGGIHPPVDDIPGRIMGSEISSGSFEKAVTYWEDELPDLIDIVISSPLIVDSLTGNQKFSITCKYDQQMDTTLSPSISFPVENPTENTLSLNINKSQWLTPYVYIAWYNVTDSSEVLMDIDISITGGGDINSKTPTPQTYMDMFAINMKNPQVISANVSTDTIFDNLSGTASFTVTVTYNEKMQSNTAPVISFPVENPIIMTLNLDSSTWINDSTYTASYDIDSLTTNLFDIDVAVSSAKNLLGNVQDQHQEADLFSVYKGITLDIGELVTNKVRVYPNPVKVGTPIKLDFPNSNTEINLQLYNTSGQLVTENNGKAKQLVLETGNVALGEYLLIIQYNDQIIKTKLVVMQ